MSKVKMDAGMNDLKEFNVIIEISAKSDPVKYEFDKSLGVLVVDRFIATGMRYPLNYGFVPETLSGDGDPVDVLVYTPYPVIPGSLVRSRAIGVLEMKDESGIDAKVIAVPTSKVCAATKNFFTTDDLPPGLCDEVWHFFENYKKLESGKWVELTGWGNVDVAYKEIFDGIARFRQ